MGCTGYSPLLYTCDISFPVRSLLNKIRHFLEKVGADFKKNQHRMLIAFHADADSKQSAADFLMSSLPFTKALLISPDLTGALLPERAATKLGAEYELVVFDATEAVYPDAVGVVSGVLRGGGCLLIMLPDKARWLSDDSLFNRHVNGLLTSGRGVYYFADEASVVSPEAVLLQTGSNPAPTEMPFHSPYLSYDQQSAVEVIERLLRAGDDCCCVLTSGRGRGKSSALGLLCAKLIQKSAMTLVLTAPRLSVAEPVFQRLAQQCPDGIAGKADFRCESGILKFMAADLLLEQLPAADVLLVDEAAVIPLSMLEKLLMHYPRIVFSTTTHGYEGTGRGFVLKFYKLLDQARAGWKKIELHQPIRWSSDDPLEKWIEALLFLNLQPASQPASAVSLNDCRIRLVDRRRLVENRPALLSVFSLLVFAHYRTSPSDFQYLLDSSNVRIYVLERGESISGVLVINQEGGFDAGLSSAVYRGERRVKGHLLAQTLCFHGGYETAACFKYARVMRIAVHPDVQQRGLGRYLLNKVTESEKRIGMDIIGSSFSATPELLNFWDKAGLGVLRMGFSRDHVSAAHSAVVAKALSSEGEKVVFALARKFQRNLPFWLEGPLFAVNTEVKSYLSARYNAFSGETAQSDDKGESDDEQDILSFARFKRNYEACMPAIKRWLNQIDLPSSGLSDKDCKVIHLRMNSGGWADIVSTLNLSGKAEAVRLLRSALNKLVEKNRESQNK